MISLVQHVRKYRLAAFALALEIGILSGSSAMAQHGGHGGGGFAGMGHGAGFAHHNFGSVGGYGFYPGYYGTVYGGYGPSYGGYGYGYGLGTSYYGEYGTGYGYPYYGYGSGYGYGNGSTFTDFGFVGPALGFGD
jgi:hypothetical protein